MAYFNTAYILYNRILSQRKIRLHLSPAFNQLNNFVSLKLNAEQSPVNLHFDPKIYASIFLASNIREKKEEIWLSPMTKAPTPTDMSKGQNDNTNNARKKFDYTAVADRLRTVSWSGYGHPTGVVNLVYGPNLPTPRNSRVIKRTHV